MKTLENLALKIRFGRTTKDTLSGDGWVFRKGKGIPDIAIALRKALSFKNGRGKFEFEQNMFELYLADILKKKRA